MIHKGRSSASQSVGPWSLQRIGELDGCRVEWASPDGLILSRKSSLFRASTNGSSQQFLGRFELPNWQRLSGRWRFAQRMLRLMFYNVLLTADGSLFVTFGRRIGVFKDGRFVELEGFLRPSRFLRGACAVGKDGAVYLGEYLPNAEHGPVTIYRWRPGSPALTVAHRFPAGFVQHVHGLYYDRFDDCFWCATGDTVAESRIMRTRDFSDFETIGSGDPTWRCISLLFTPEGVYYGSDAPYAPNAIFRIDRRTGERKRLAEVNGPIYYSQMIGRDLFFGVGAELCPSQTDGCASLWHRGEDGVCRKLASFQKDSLPVRLFMPGTIDFAQGPQGADRLWFGLTALEDDGATYCLRRFG